MLILVQALGLGLAYAMPLGPQNVYVIHSALTRPWSTAWRVPFVVSVVDVSLALACFYGIGVLLETSQFLRPTILAIGSLFLIFIGIRIILDRKKILGQRSEEESIRWSRILRSAFILTWLNPQAILDGSLLFGSYRASLDSSSIPLFLLGITAASPIWFFSLSALVGWWRPDSVEKLFGVVSWICGLILVAYGINLGLQFSQVVL